MTLLQYTALYFNEILIDKKAVMKFLHFVTALFILLFIGNSRASAFSNFLFAESVKRVCVSTRRQRKLRKPQTLRTANYLCHYDTALVTSTHFSYPEHFSSFRRQGIPFRTCSATRQGKRLLRHLQQKGILRRQRDR